MTISQETLNAVWAALGIIAANFVLTIVTAVRQQRAQKKTQKELASTQQQIDSVQQAIPAQVQNHIQQPLSDLQTQIEKSLTSSAGVMATVGQTVNDLIANYQNQADNSQRQFSLVAQQLQDSLEHNRSLEKQLFDNKVFIEGLLKGQAEDLTERKKLFAEIDTLKAQVEAMRVVRKADNDRIAQLTRALQETKRELTNALTQLKDYQDQLDAIRKDREQVRGERDEMRQQLEAERVKTASLQEQVNALMTEVASLKAQLVLRDQQEAGKQVRAALASVFGAVAEGQAVTAEDGT